ncbi:MAG: hypothetical protein K9N23_17935 [Akkermansiaceae bacterium]|nr:hypothetical protein [Akkermansiaceae bacterium]MCF7733575.1 hypothetical protein [Akkermansiaceae bacterium]
MSPLPQQKKTPAELAKLRESLGILAAPETDSVAPEDTPPPTPVEHLRLHHSLKRSERVGVPVAAPAALGETVPHLDVPGSAETVPHLDVPGSAETVPHLDVPGSAETVPHLDVPGSAETVPHLDAPAPAAQPSHRGPQRIRSLKRSERQPPPSRPRAAPPVASGKLPGYRHSAEELAEIRRRSAVEAIAEGGFELPASASKLLLGCGYLLSLGGAAAPTVLGLLAKLTDSYRLGMALDEGYHLLLAGCLTALPVAAYIALRKTQSRHHAAFITIIAFFALIFATLHYFPFLRHGP